MLQQAWEESARIAKGEKLRRYWVGARIAARTEHLEVCRHS